MIFFVRAGLVLDTISRSLQVHTKFEEQFWGTKMALKDGTLLSSGTAPPNYSVPALTETKQRMEDFLADPKKLERARELLKGELSPEQRKVLTLFERTFKCYIMENSDAKALREEATKIEGSLESERNKCAPLLASLSHSARSFILILHPQPSASHSHPLHSTR